MNLSSIRADQFYRTLHIARFSAFICSCCVQVFLWLNISCCSLPDAVFCICESSLHYFINKTFCLTVCLLYVDVLWSLENQLECFVVHGIKSKQSKLFSISTLEIVPLLINIIKCDLLCIGNSPTCMLCSLDMQIRIYFTKKFFFSITNYFSHVHVSDSRDPFHIWSPDKTFSSFLNLQGCTSQV